jgi:hypothetical protein
MFGHVLVMSLDDNGLDLSGKATRLTNGNLEHGRRL